MPTPVLCLPARASPEPETPKLRVPGPVGRGRRWAGWCVTEHKLGCKTPVYQMGPASGTWRPQASGIEGRTGEPAGDRPDKSWVRAPGRDRCQRVPTRHDETPNHSVGGDMTML